MIYTRFLLIQLFFVVIDAAFVGHTYFKKSIIIRYAPPNNRCDQIFIDDTQHLRENPSSGLFMLKDKKHPFLGIITETDACDSDERVDETFETIREALGTNNQDGVDLISIRVRSIGNDSNSCKEQAMVHQKRIVDLATRIMTLKEKISINCTSSKSKNDFIVVINDNVSAALESQVDGVHVKETKVSDIGRIRKLLQEGKHNSKRGNESANDETSVIIGTSAHSVDTALSAWRSHKPDYFFVGTCYLTKSHPEKDLSDLEGPSLPGLVRQKIKDEQTREDCSNIPHVFAIGGIDDENCREPVVTFGADGVAVIRAVMQSSEPRSTILSMKEKMQS